jgi:hypothetical protein
MHLLSSTFKFEVHQRNNKEELKWILLKIKDFEITLSWLQICDLRVNHDKIQWHDFLEYLCRKHFAIKQNTMLHKVDMYYYHLICLLLALYPTSMQHIYLRMPRIISLCITQLWFKGLPFLAAFPKWSCHVQDVTVTCVKLMYQCLSINPLAPALS